MPERLEVTEYFLCAQYCMPTDAPHLAQQASPIAQLISPMLWLNHKPDRFDSYSAGSLEEKSGISKHLCMIACSDSACSAVFQCALAQIEMSHSSVYNPLVLKGLMSAPCLIMYAHCSPVMLM